MQVKHWQAPDYNYQQLQQEVKRQFFLPHDGVIDPSSYYLDHEAAAEWCAISHHSNYVSTFDNLSEDWPEWIAQVVLRHLRTTPFSADKIDVVGLGVGDGYKEMLLCRGLVNGTPLKHLRCFLMDLSPDLLKAAESVFMKEFAEDSNVEAWSILGDFEKIHKYKALFGDSADANTLRIGAMYGILSNLPSERNFMEQCLPIFKSGDVLLVDVPLGFAPADRADLIKEADPSFYPKEGLEWLTGVLKRNRPATKEVRFDCLIKQGVSIFPNTYTLDIQATADNDAVFSMFHKHRYNVDDFVKTFQSFGWKPLEGKQYGYDDRQLIYLFAKE